MTSLRFDPFNNRQARDIRNNLSKSFLQALAAKDVSIFQRCATHYRHGNIAPVFDRYIKNRIARYEEAFVIIEQNKLKDVLQRAAIFWDLELYFEMHELLETEWKIAVGDRRRALQGLIRAAGMNIHAENGNMKAAGSMGAKALADLLKYGDQLTDFSRLESILATIKNTMALIRNNPPV